MLENDVAQRRRVCRGDMHEEVVRARDMEHLQHAGRVGEGIGEGVHALGRVVGQPDADHRLQRIAEGVGLDAHPRIADHPARLQRPDAMGARRLRDLESLRERLVGDVAVLREDAEDRDVEFVESTCVGRLRSRQNDPPFRMPPIVEKFR